MLEINIPEFPVLRTERLLLRQTTQEDASVLFRLRSNPDVMRYIDRPLAKTRADAEELIQKVTENFEKRETLHWTICLENNPEMLGLILLWKFDLPNHRAEVGYMLDPAFHRQGIMDEALKAVLKYGFHTLFFHSIEANVNPGNEASMKLLEKNGFVKEAHYRENYYFNGRFLDTVIYGLLAREF